MTTHAERHRERLRIIREAKEAYEKRGLTLRELAEGYGVHHVTMGEWLRGAGCRMRRPGGNMKGWKEKET